MCLNASVSVCECVSMWVRACACVCVCVRARVTFCVSCPEYSSQNLDSKDLLLCYAEEEAFVFVTALGSSSLLNPT